MVRMILVLVLCLLCGRAFAAVRGDGSTARVYVGASSTNLNLTNEITVAFWLVKEVGLANSSEYVNKGRGSSATSANYAVRDDAAGGLELYWANPAGTFHGIKSVSKFTSTNTPVHFAVTHQFGTTNNTMFWINGARANVQASFGTPQSNGTITNAGKMDILGYDGGGVHAKAAIYDLYILDVRLSDVEIKSLASGLQLQPHRYGSALRGAWRFDELPGFATAAGRAFHDGTAWNNDAIATNSPQARPSFNPIP